MQKERLERVEVKKGRSVDFSMCYIVIFDALLWFNFS